MARSIGLGTASTCRSVLGLGLGTASMLRVGVTVRVRISVRVGYCGQVYRVRDCFNV